MPPISLLPPPSKVGSFNIHPRYNETMHANDLAVLVLAEPLLLSGQLARPACLPTQPVGSLVGRNATASGWGAVEAGANSVQFLQIIDDLEILPNCLNSWLK